MGDQVLIKLSSLVETNLRANDSFVRCGREEFICLLPETNLEKSVDCRREDLKPDCKL